jgi:DNA-binding response OmpR family regulator
VAEREHPSAIILGWELPELSGAQVVAALRAQRSLHNTPIMVLNADGTEPDDVHSLSLSQSNPISRTELRAQVHAAFAPVHVEVLPVTVRRRASGVPRTYRRGSSSPSGVPNQP